MGVGLSPIQEPAPVPCADLPPQSILKGILSSSHCLVNVTDLGQGHLADDLWWSRAMKPSLCSVDTDTLPAHSPGHLDGLRGDGLPMEEHWEDPMRRK